MKAVTVEGFGSELKVAEVATPEPEATEVQIKVAYAGVNPVDWKICEGYLKNWLHHDFPIIPGWDVAGTITAIGRDVEDFRVGDEIYAYCRKPVVRWGSFAEFVCVEYRHVALKPKSLSFAEAASVPLAGLTAWQALFDFCDLQSGQTIMVHAGAGGVGCFAVQLAKNAGATVLATASKHNHPYLQELGADISIDYHDQSFVQVVREKFPDGLDVVFDCVGGDTLTKSLEIVKRGGCLPSIVQPIKEDFGKNYEIKTGFVFVLPNGQQLATIGNLFDEGKIKAPRIEEFALSDVNRALDKSRQGHVCGKLVLKVQ